MARSTGAKRARKPKDNSGAASLIEALKFISLAQQKEGTPQQTHCIISGGTITAANGVFAAGHLIEDDLHACPHTARLLDALCKCGPNLAITQLDSGRLSIKSDRFKAFVPCIAQEQLPAIEPDTVCAIIDDKLKTGFELVAPVLNEGAPNAIMAGALLQSGSVVGTNGAMLLEYWHGIDLPNNLLIPKATLQAVCKTPKKLARFGFSPNSVTFYFDDDSFIKSQLFSAAYPDYQVLFPDKVNPWPLPEGFFEGLKKIHSLADDNIVHFEENGFVVMDSQKTPAGSYELQGLKTGAKFNIEYLLTLEPAFKQVDFEAVAGRVFFFGELMRGILMGLR